MKKLKFHSIKKVDSDIPLSNSQSNAQTKIYGASMSFFSFSQTLKVFHIEYFNISGAMTKFSLKFQFHEFVYNTDPRRPFVHVSL